jgi:hypothetical protein
MQPAFSRSNGSPDQEFFFPQTLQANTATDSLCRNAFGAQETEKPFHKSKRPSPLMQGGKGL